MKRFVIAFVLLLAVVFCIFDIFYENEKKKEETKTTTANITAEASEATAIPEKSQNEIYAVWLTYSEISSLVKGKGEKEYRKAVESVLKNLSENKINTVFYQCRAFCDSFYDSEIFPASKYISADMKELSFDPFEIFLEKARAYNVFVHCWINPYRVSYDKYFKKLPENSPARALYKEDKNALFICEKGIFLNPAHTECRKLVLSGVREILEKYQVSGIHFDDYFYPEADDINDKKLYEEYLKKGGALALADWRRENVSSLMGSVYSLVKAFDESLIFSISPSADIEKCKNIYYADVEKWCKEEGYADFIIPQIYYGLENEKMPFSAVAEEWGRMAQNSNVKLVCGLASYKCGEPDNFAGGGKNEWTENVNILSQQYEQVLKSPVWQGFSLFSYSYCFGENMNENSKKEIKNLLYMIE